MPGYSRRLEEEEQKEEGEASESLDSNATVGNGTVSDDGISLDSNETYAKKGFEAHFPAPFLNQNQIQNGGFILYFLGIMYMFQGISLVTQNYINPAIDTIKKKGILGSDTMNATLLAFSNSAAESFIVVNSIFMGVPDIGI